MKCSFSRLLYPKRLEEARDGSYMIALFKPNEKLLDAQGNRLSSIKVVGHFLPTVAGVKVDMTGHWKKDARYSLRWSPMRKSSALTSAASWPISPRE